MNTTFIKLQVSNLHNLSYTFRRMFAIFRRAIIKMNSIALLSSGGWKYKGISLYCLLQGTTIQRFLCIIVSLKIAKVFWNMQERLCIQITVIL